MSVPPRGFTAEDRELLGAVQSVELAVRDLYQVAIDAGADDDVYRGIRDNHRAYADRLAGVIGRTSRGSRDEQLFDDQRSAFEASGNELATAAYDLESSLVATHAEVLGQLQGIDGANAIASIAMVEARHCAVLADVAGLGDDLDAVFGSEAAEPLDVPAGAQG